MNKKKHDSNPSPAATIGKPGVRQLDMAEIPHVCGGSGKARLYFESTFTGGVVAPAGTGLVVGDFVAGSKHN